MHLVSQEKWGQGKGLEEVPFLLIECTVESNRGLALMDSKMKKKKTQHIIHWQIENKKSRAVTIKQQSEIELI